MSKSVRYRTQKMSNEFTKYLFLHHEPGEQYFHTVLHHFTGIDIGGPHDHPFNFRSYILQGSYVEKVYHICPDGTFRTELIHRKQGTVHEVFTHTIHELVELPERECWTAIVPTSPRKIPWHFWTFDKTGIYRRTKRQKNFTKYVQLPHSDKP